MTNATIGKRIGAYIADSFIATVFAGIAGMVLYLALGVGENNPVIMLAAVLVQYIYFVLQENGAKHATFGKRMMKIAVARPDGSAPATIDVLVRNAVKLLPGILAAVFAGNLPVSELSGVAYIVFFLVTVFSKTKRAPHDMVAGTVVALRESLPADAPQTPDGSAGAADVQRTIAPAFSSATRTLYCTSGVFRGATFPLDLPVVMGRGTDDVSVRFPADTKGVSRKHLRVTADGDEVHLTDLGSTYGIDLNGTEHMRAHEERVLHAGDSFTIGKNETFLVR